MWLASSTTLVLAQGFGLPLSALLQTILALVVTAGLSVLVLRVLQPLSAAGILRKRPDLGAPLHLVARLPLSQGQSVYLVRAFERYLLLGQNGATLCLLTELSPNTAQPAPTGAQVDTHDR